MAVKRGEIYWVEFDPVKGSEQGGLRPALVVQNDKRMAAVDEALRFNLALGHTGASMTSATAIFLDALAGAIASAGAYNQNDQCPAAAILWPDKERE